GGIAATFNAPLAGVVFAMEIILRDFAARSFGMVVVSSVTASVVARAVLGDHAFLDLPRFSVGHVAAYGLFAVLGVLAGVVGVVTPSLFLGAMLGGAFGQTCALLVPGTSGAAGGYALVGMAAVFAGAARAPITAVLIVFELTGEYSLILPLMLAVSLATGVGN